MHRTRCTSGLSLLIMTFYVIILFIGCQSSEQKVKNQADSETTNQRDTVSNTLQDGVLTALVDNSITSYFIYKGRPFGFEYEMLKLFTQEHNLQLRIKIIYDVDHILDSLAAGRGDVVAANLTISKSRSKKVAFTKPLFRTRQILVQRLPENAQKMTKDEIKDHLITDRLDMAGKTIYVRPNTSYNQRLQNFIDETNTNIKINEVSGDVVTEKLIEMVSDGEIDYTISDENKAKINAAYYDNIDISTPMSLSEPIGWAVNKHATTLLDTLNEWIDKRRGSLEYNIVKNKYFNIDSRTERTISKNYEIVKSGRISKYDELIKKYATKLHWDWKLLSAQVYKESRFNPDARSWQGAVGLMQVLPTTAKQYGVSATELSVPDYNLKAGTSYLGYLEKHWMNESLDSVQVIKFTLASYNVGLGHVEDAQKLAQKYGYDQNIWDGNVEEMILNKSIPKYYEDPIVQYGYCRGKEPVDYVEDILKKYILYTEFVRGR